MELLDLIDFLNSMNYNIHFNSDHVNTHVIIFNKNNNNIRSSFYLRKEDFKLNIVCSKIKLHYNKITNTETF